MQYIRKLPWGSELVGELLGDWLLVREDDTPLVAIYGSDVCSLSRLRGEVDQIFEDRVDPERQPEFYPEL